MALVLNQEVVNSISSNTCLYDRFAGNWRTWLQMLACAVLRKPTIIIFVRYAHVCVCCLRLISCIFTNFFWLFVDKKFWAIRRHRGLLPSNTWALLGFELCSSSNKFIASLLPPSDHSVFALMNVSTPNGVEKNISTPKGGTISFVYSYSKLVCLICNATEAMKSKGI